MYIVQRVDKKAVFRKLLAPNQRGALSCSSNNNFFT